MIKDYIFPKKSELKTISIEDLDMEMPDLKNTTKSKSMEISKWMISTIEKNLKEGKIKPKNVLPSKAEFAYLLGVSTGTMQNAFRYVEDLGYIESKQCIGSVIKDRSQNISMRKLTSKREMAVDAVKRYILTEAFQIGYALPSSKIISEKIGYSANTTRLALEYLTNQGILEHKYRKSSETGWYVKNLDLNINEKLEKTETLVEMVAKDIEEYISENLKTGDRMPAHSELANNLKASIKTVHEALKILINKGILLARRGKYGTFVLKHPHEATTGNKPETSIFAPAKDAAFYHYEKTQNMMKKMIAAEYEVGDKLPSIMELSKKYDLSPNTIRKAFHNLSKEGYLVFSRGRYGGTFVIDIPEIETTAFKWIAVNPNYAKELEEVENN